MNAYHSCLEVIRLDNALWPQVSLYRVIYYSYYLCGEWALEPTTTYFDTPEELDLWLYDRFTDSLQDETCFKARVYRRADGGAQFVKAVTYP